MNKACGASHFAVIEVAVLLFARSFTITFTFLSLAPTARFAITSPLSFGAVLNYLFQLFAVKTSCWRFGLLFVVNSVASEGCSGQRREDFVHRVGPPMIYFNLAGLGTARIPGTWQKIRQIVLFADSPVQPNSLVFYLSIIATPSRVELPCQSSVFKQLC